jgi:hypothetical protein
MGAAHWLRKPGQAYAIYLEEGGPVVLDLPGQAGRFRARWYSPDTGQYSDGGLIS